MTFKPSFQRAPVLSVRSVFSAFRKHKALADFKIVFIGWEMLAYKLLLDDIIL